MALVNQDLVLDVVPGPIPPILHLTEYDENMEVVVMLMRRGQPFQIPTGTTVKIEGTLNGHPFSEDGTPSGNTVTFMVSKNMTAYSGRAWTKIVLKKDDKPVSSCGFWLNNDRAGVEAGAVIHDSGFQEQITNAVNNWLESDEGIADAVQDAVDEYASEHGIVISNGFVTPEDYGAKGDGTTDDTAAIQLAVDSGRNVMFGYGKTYKCGTINVAKNIEIDCRWSEFVCTAETLFNCTGKVVESVAGADYVANAPYTLLNDDKYTGYALLRSTDNVITMREYYYGGFVTLFTEGVCNDLVPIGFSGVTVDKIEPITCKIKNVGNVIFTENVSGNNKNTVVKCTYGLACDFDGFDVDGDYYSTVYIVKSYACRIANVYGFQTYTGTQENYYALSLIDSSNCLTENCDFTSDWWAAWDAGGNLFCLNNKTRNCNFHAGEGTIAYGEHSNALFSYIENCEFDNADVNAGATLIDVVINENKTLKGSAQTDCRLLLQLTNISGINNFIVGGIRFNFKTSHPTYFGVIANATAYTTGNHFYLDNLYVSKLSCNNESYSGRQTISLSPAESVGDFTVNGNIVLDDVVGSFYLHPTNVYPYVTFLGISRTIIKNCKSFKSDGKVAFQVGTSSGHKFPPVVEVLDSDVRVYGEFDTLKLINVGANTPYDVLGGFKANSLYANNVARLLGTNSAMLTNFVKAVVTNMRYAETTLWTYLYIKNGAGNYGLLGANGVVNTDLS